MPKLIENEQLQAHNTFGVNSHRAATNNYYIIIFIYQLICELFNKSVFRKPQHEVLKCLVHKPKRRSIYCSKGTKNPEIFTFTKLKSENLYILSVHFFFLLSFYGLL